MSHNEKSSAFLSSEEISNPKSKLTWKRRKMAPSSNWDFSSHPWDYILILDSLQTKPRRQQWNAYIWVHGAPFLQWVGGGRTESALLLYNWGGEVYTTHSCSIYKLNLILVPDPGSQRVLLLRQNTFHSRGHW